jgi:hypothetical protein
MKSNIQDSIDSMEEAKKKDEDLAAAQETHNKQSEEALAEADKIAKQKQDISNEALDLDWHKKR